MMSLLYSLSEICIAMKGIQNQYGICPTGFCIVWLKWYHGRKYVFIKKNERPYQFLGLYIGPGQLVCFPFEHHKRTIRTVQGIFDVTRDMQLLYFDFVTPAVGVIQVIERNAS